MGQVTILTREQELILEEFTKNPFLRRKFYFSGGTALSEIYLDHRESVDLDFFSEEKFEPQTILSVLSEWGHTHNFTLQPQRIEETYIYFLNFPNAKKLKVDFAYYPFTRLEKGTVYKGITVDSLVDIAANKLLLINQRDEVKDFVDLYFLLGRYTIWDLIEGVKIKFRIELEPLLLAADFLKIESVDYLPRMIAPLTLKDLVDFYKTQAKKLGGTFVK